MPAPLRRLLGRPFSFEPQTVCREHGGANDRLCMYRHRHTRAVLRRPRPLPYRQRPQRHLHQHDADAAIDPGGPAPRRSFPLELRRHERRLFVGFSAAGYFQATESYSSLFIFATLGNFVAIVLAMFMWKTLADRNTPLLDATRKQFQLRQSPHNEIRKSEKDSSHKTRAECCDKRQEVDRIIHLSKSAGAFSDVVFIVRIEIPR